MPEPVVLPNGALWDMRVGDAVASLRQLPDDYFDALLSDPPYHLKAGKRGGAGFMGKAWDGGDVAFRPETWAEVLRVLKPGAFAMVFGGTRTFHRLACALEDGGFEIVDTCMWVYSQGFPKSHNVSKAIDKAAGAQPRVVGYDASRPRPNKANYAKRTDRQPAAGAVEGWRDNGATQTAPTTPEAQAWDGYGSALKPAWEPVLLVRKPTRLTYAANALEQGCGALNIDGARVGTDGGTRVPSEGGSGPSLSTFGDGLNGAYGELVPGLGRWPANVVLDDEAAAVLDAQTGVLSSGNGPRPLARGADEDRRNTYSAFMPSGGESVGALYGDAGGASRFFNRAGFEEGETEELARFFYSSKASPSERDAGLSGRNVHPTVKPLALTRHWATLLLPPEGTSRRLLVPFGGVGSEGIGAVQAGWSEVVLLEGEAAYAAVAEARARYWAGLLLEGRLVALAADVPSRVETPVAPAAPSLGPLFAGLGVGDGD